MTDNLEWKIGILNEVWECHNLEWKTAWILE